LLLIASMYLIILSIEKPPKIDIKKSTLGFELVTES